MDKILSFINNKTNNKYENLLFFDAVFDTKKSTMQINFKASKEIINSPENTEELKVICKQFLPDFIKDVSVKLYSNTLSIEEFKNIVYKQIDLFSELGLVDKNLISFNFDGDVVNIVVVLNNTILTQSQLQDILINLSTSIFNDTKMMTNILFKTEEKNNTDILNNRKNKILEDNQIYEAIRDSQYVTVKNLNAIHGEISAQKAILAGNFDGNTQLVMVGTIKNCYERETAKKINDEEQTADKIKKYISFEIEFEGKSTRCTWFYSKDITPQILSIGSKLVVEGQVNEFNGQKSIRVKSLAYCDFDEPKQVWHSVPTQYSYIKPESYEFFKQATFFDFENVQKNEYLANNTFVVYDLETTGINPEYNKIIDIGAFKIVNGKITEKFASFINPEMPIPAEASSINHITDQMVVNSPTIDQALPDFYKFCHGSIVLGYNNTGFDDLYIKKEAKRLRYNFDNPRDDVFVLAKKYIKGLKNYKLSTVCEAEGVQLIDAHRATNDALATAKLFINIIEKYS